MGHCKHGKSGLCMKAGVECYQNGLHADSSNMTLEDFRNLAIQCKGQTYQFALGGCGDPEQHENFKEILEICRENEIVHNFTTSGLGMTEELAKLCKEYCGAVAVSWYRSEYTLQAIDMLLKADVKTNIHYVLNKKTIEEARMGLKDHTFPVGINAIIFLLHKPVGLGKRDNMVTIDNSEFQKLIQEIATQKQKYKIGFDSCTIPALINSIGIIDPDSLDTCEGARWSAYVTADMQMLPCSFDSQKQNWAVDLRKYSVQEAWNSKEFNEFRGILRNSCPDCIKRDMRMGGCPICPESVLCSELQNK